MSWSFNATGRAGAVAQRAVEEMGRNACQEPEEGYRQEILNLVADLANGLVVQGGGVGVQVSAQGSMWKDGDTVKSCTHSLSFVPLHGFVE